jgi:hypothetical protein
MDKKAMRKQMRLNDDEDRVKRLAALLGAEIELYRKKSGIDNFCNDELAVLRALYVLRNEIVGEEKFDMLSLSNELNRVVVMDMLSSDTIKHVHIHNGKEVDMGEAGS